MRKHGKARDFTRVLQTGEADLPGENPAPLRCLLSIRRPVLPPRRHPAYISDIIGAAPVRPIVEAMADDRSNYAGLAGAAVFLAGLLIVGNATVRLAVLALVGFFVALVTSPTASRQLIVCAIAIALCSALVAYKARTSEVTGKATYFNGHGRWFLGTEMVTREDSPARFRQATNETWAASLFLAMVSGGCFMFNRKFRSAEDLP